MTGEPRNGIAPSHAIAAGIRWLGESPVSVREGGSPLDGGVHAEYSARTRAYRQLYCEITGYAVQFFLRVGNGNPEGLARARRSAEFLLRAQNERESHGPAALPVGYSQRNGAWLKVYYSFDNAICLAALIDVFHATGDRRYLNTARPIGDWLIGRMLRPDGSFEALFRTGHDPLEGKRWHDRSGCLHGKNAIGLLKLAAATHDRDYELAARTCLDYVLGLQQPDGSFIVHEGAGYVFAHAHAYALEGLLYAAIHLKDDRYWRAFHAGVSWLTRSQNRDGSVDQFRGRDAGAYLDSTDARWPWLQVRFPPHEAGATAQAMRLWLASHFLGSPKTLGAARRANRFLLGMQDYGGDAATNGAFRRSRYRFGFARLTVPVYYPWTTMFACQAMEWLDRIEGLTEDDVLAELF